MLSGVAYESWPSNPQQGFVDTDRAKVQRKSSGLLEQFTG
jgi:hypothetical protein